jgi:DNA repair protein RecN (Recombination protein N)
MLSSIQVRNFAIIDEVEVEFASGMTVLTGETGAGKSILVDAMGLVLGERGGAGLVRSGARRAEFTAEFDLRNLPAAREWLEEQMLDLDDECILRRVVSADGRSRAFINGNNVPLQSLKSLGELLLDIHGQHFHQSLARRDVQREMLDYFGGLVDLTVATDNAYSEWREKADKLESLDASDADREAKLDLLRFQIGELEALDLQPGEYEALMSERARLQNSGRLAEGVTAALHRIYDADEVNAHLLVAEASRDVETLASLDESLQPAANLLSEASIQLGEAADVLRRYGDALDMDPARQNFVEERLDAVTNLARKHRTEPEDIDELLQNLCEQRDDLEHAEERGEALREAAAAAGDAFRQLAGQLTRGRLKAAKRFGKAVTDAMGDLGMPGGVFEVGISPRSADSPRASGMDDIEFLISANPGQDPQPLSRIASGGELSRMSLAIQVIASDGSRIPTMVFDEVDSGVGGGIAEMVGMRMRELGRTRQVFCVTHLPQVASLGNHHFRIMKLSDGKSTRTSITALSDDERVEEIARMLGGVEITQRTRDHAAEMLSAERGAPAAGKRA